MEFTSTEKGRRKLLKDGHSYVFQKNLANGVTSWECILRRKGECKAKVKLSEFDQFLGQINEHTHAPSDLTCEVAKAKAGIKRRPQTSNNPSRCQILAGELSNLSDTASVILPSMESMRRNIRRARQVKRMRPMENEELGERCNGFHHTSIDGEDLHERDDELRQFEMDAQSLKNVVKVIISKRPHLQSELFSVYKEVMEELAQPFKR